MFFHSIVAMDNKSAIACETKRYNTITKEGYRNIMIVGPIPPPIGGSGLTLKSIIDVLPMYDDIGVKLINTSPLTDPRKKMTGINLEKFSRMWHILTAFAKHVRYCDVVLVFANNLFAFTIVPHLLLLAKYHHKPFYLKPVGGDMDAYLLSLQRPIRSLLLKFLCLHDGILAQTQLLTGSLQRSGCRNVYYLPGCRNRPIRAPQALIKHRNLRLIFLGHITREKGVFILLEALRILHKNSLIPIHCDFFGLVNKSIQNLFFSQTNRISHVHYCGPATPGTGTQLISKYDALVLPTSFACEGHPGVIIEAMHAGVPVISTLHRAIPELIVDGENGFLVPPQNPMALADAIKRLFSDQALRSKMGQSNFRMGEQFDTKTVVQRMIEIFFGSRTSPTNC